MSHEVQPQIIPPGAGPSYTAFGDTITLHLSGEQTGGTVAVFTAHTKPGGGPPLHYHLNEDEMFLVQEGRHAFYRNSEWVEADPGTIVHLPKGSIHTFKNISDQPGKLLVTTRPAGFDVFFARCSAEFAKPEPPAMDKLIAIAAEHGIHFVQG